MNLISEEMGHDYSTLPNSMTVGGSYSDHVGRSENSDTDPEEIRYMVQKEWRRFSWEKGELLDRDTDERLEVYLMSMEAYGFHFQGSGLYFHGDLAEIEDIEVKPI